MWPFNRKRALPGYSSISADGKFTFEVTPDEQVEIDKLLSLYQGYVVKSEFAEEVKNSTIASGLVNYAERQVQSARFGSDKARRTKLLEQAMASYGKAFAFHRLPVYLYLMAEAAYELGGLKEAKPLYQHFLRAQGEYVVSDNDRPYLDQWDVDAAVKNAKAHLKMSC
jgi:tetratricopeptide (TPR) repeat protein